MSVTILVTLNSLNVFMFLNFIQEEKENKQNKIKMTLFTYILRTMAI